MMLLVVGQMILACHDRPLTAPRLLGGADGAGSVAALIAASLCRSPGSVPLTEERSGATTASCLHCTSGGCHGATRAPTVGAWAAFVALNLPMLYRSNADDDGAAPWQTGHPVRGPPLSGL
jgi:hypothetical protein